MRAARSLLALGVIVVTSFVLSASALAVQPGVFVAPGSPAGREYSFPLSVLRNASTGQPPPASGAEPLFGAGITPAAQGASLRPIRGAKSATSSGRGAASGPSGTAALSSSARGGSVPLSSREIASLTRPSSSTSQILLVGLPVLFGGLALGLALVAARRSRD